MSPLRTKQIPAKAETGIDYSIQIQKKSQAVIGFNSLFNSRIDPYPAAAVFVQTDISKGVKFGGTFYHSDGLLSSASVRFPGTVPRYCGYRM
jgi:hypothetical protein